MSKELIVDMLEYADHKDAERGGAGEGTLLLREAADALSAALSRAEAAEARAEEMEGAAAIGLAVLRAEPETVERVARLLAQKEWDDAGSEFMKWDEQHELVRHYWRGNAAAAIAALKETPSPVNTD